MMLGSPAKQLDLAARHVVLNGHFTMDGQTATSIKESDQPVHPSVVKSHSYRATFTDAARQLADTLCTDGLMRVRSDWSIPTAA